MGALFKLILCLYLLSLIISLFGAFIRFVIDVGKWHNYEKKVNIISSKESEVLEYGRTNNDISGDSGTGDNDNNNSGESGRGEPLKF